MIFSRADAEPLISRVRCVPKTFNPLEGEPVKIDFYLSRKGLVWLDVRDEERRLIYSEKPGNIYETGTHTLEWDGKSGEGKPVSSGVYTYIINGKDEAGEHETFDPWPDTWGLPLIVDSVDYDKKKGVIRYLIPRAGRARIRIGIKEGPLMITLMDWEAQEAGLHEKRWDGMDKSCLMKVHEYPEAYIIINAYSIADNSIIIKGSHKERKKANESGQIIKDSFPTITPSGERRYFHANHAPWICKEPEAFIRLHGAARKGEEYVVKRGKTPVTIDAPPESREQLMASRFEIILFVDAIFLMEDEEGYFPYTYIWDTTSINPGEHLLILNLVSYEDHIAVKTIRVIIEDE